MLQSNDWRATYSSVLKQSLEGRNSTKGNSFPGRMKAPNKLMPVMDDCTHKPRTQREYMQPSHIQTQYIKVHACHIHHNTTSTACLQLLSDKNQRRINKSSPNYTKWVKTCPLWQEPFPLMPSLCMSSILEITIKCALKFPWNQRERCFGF